MTAGTFQQITHPDDLALDLDYLQRTLAGELGSYQMEKRYIRADGTEVWVLLSVTLVRAADGTPLHFVAHAQDIDARKQRRRALPRRRTALPDTRRAAPARACTSGRST